MKILTNSKLLLAIVIILTVPSFISLVRPGFFPMQDDLQAFRIFEMNRCFSDYQFPCRWVPDAGYQYGYPLFNYYPPSVYYLGELFHLIGFQFIDSVKILFCLGYLLSALGMFLLLNEIFDPLAAFTGSLLYTYIPYKAVEVYVRGAMSEFWSLVLFPLVFYTLVKLIREGSNRYMALSASSIGGLLITHNLMSLIFLPIAGIWGLLVVYLEEKWRVLPKIVVSFLLGFGLAAFFTLPVLVEKPYAHLETLLGGYFGYQQHFVDLYQLFISNHWGYGSSILGPYDDLSLSTGQIAWMLSLVGITLSFIYFRKNRRLSIMMLTLGLIEVVVLFMIHVKSSFIWDRIGALAYLQFPWRFLADSIFLLSILGAGAIYLIKDKKVALALSVLSITLAFILYGNFFQPKAWLNITDAQKFSGASWDKQLTISIFDYLPIFAKLPPTTPAPVLPETLQGQVKFIRYKKGSDFQEGTVNVTKDALIRLPLFDFPGMKVWVDGKEISHTHTNCLDEEFCLGLINFNITQGTHIMSVKLTNTPIRFVGNLISLLSLVSFTLLLWVKNKKSF